MITLDDLKDHSVLTLLDKYTGINPYIKQLKAKYLENKKINLTDNQTRYIRDNFERVPQKIQRIIGISPYFGAELQKSEGLEFLPEKMLFEYILADNDKTYHVYGKIRKGQKSKLYWVPKTQVMEDPYFENIKIDVDFTWYESIFAKEDKKVMEHQKEGVKFLLSRDCCILGYGMGTTKSAIAVMAALESKSQRILVVCPSAVKINWEREINRFCNDTRIVDGKDWGTARFTIINYDILKNFHTIKDKKSKVEFKGHTHLRDAKFDLVIIDEAHYLKDPKKIRGSIMNDLCLNHGIVRVWLLTGTPVANRPMDFYNLLKLIKSPIADNWAHYARRYCDAKQFYKTVKNSKFKKKIWLTNGASNLEELYLKTKNIILRKDITELSDMPDKIVSLTYHKLDPKARIEYEGLWEAYIEKRKKEKKKGEVDKELVESLLLRKFIANQGIKHTIEMAEVALEEGKKVIIFTNFNDEQDTLAEHFGDLCVRHNGGMSIKAKQESIDRFQTDDKIRVFIGNIKSAGIGITLTAGIISIFNSFEWVPAWNEQCEYRNFRVGQKNNIFIYYHMFDDTVTLRMWNTLRDKTGVISTILTGEKSDIQVTEEIFDYILDAA